MNTSITPRGLSSAKTFDRQVQSYDQHAHVQRIAALLLADVIRDFSEEIHKGCAVIEYGAGTGGVTEHLVRLFAGNNILVTDLSRNMLDYVYDTYSRYHNVQYEVHDANFAHPRSAVMPVAVSGFTLQWLEDPVASIADWLRAMPSNGLAFMTWPGDGSFPEWRQMALQAGVAFTANPLPGTCILDSVVGRGGARLRYHSMHPVSITYPDAYDFFRGLLEIGAGAETGATQGSRNLLKLIRHWNGYTGGVVTVTYNVHVAVLQKI